MQIIFDIEVTIKIIQIIGKEDLTKALIITEIQISGIKIKEQAHENTGMKIIKAHKTTGIILLLGIS